MAYKRANKGVLASWARGVWQGAGDAATAVTVIVAAAAAAAA